MLEKEGNEKNIALADKYFSLLNYFYRHYVPC